MKPMQQSWRPPLVMKGSSICLDPCRDLPRRRLLKNKQHSVLSSWAGVVLPAGMDATDEFNSIHSSKAKAMLKDYYIGELVTPEQKQAALAAAASKAAPAAISITANSSSHSTANGIANGNGVVAAVAVANGASELVALDPRKKIPFKLAEKIELSHNVRLFRFALQSPQHKFGLPVGKHVFLYANVGGETVMRAYTPTSQDKDLGHFDLVIKVYRWAALSSVLVT